ncbi:MAG: hypothetical protein WCP97_06200 [bacterium]
MSRNDNVQAYALEPKNSSELTIYRASTVGYDVKTGKVEMGDLQPIEMPQLSIEDHANFEGRLKLLIGLNKEGIDVGEIAQLIIENDEFIAKRTAGLHRLYPPDITLTPDDIAKANKDVPIRIISTRHDESLRR